MASEVIESLKSLSEQDLVTVVVDGETYTGFVSYYYHDESERIDGIPTRGSLSVDVELDTKTVNEKDLPSHQLQMSVREKRPGKWDEPSVNIWDPVADENGHLLENEYTNIGGIDKIERREESD